ncbi:phospholipase/carboxylesterase family protein [Hypoxylon argillaceum]|nr:phospholipase/carboxylesterase family protein [Hypoxylon argillaceum]
MDIPTIITGPAPAHAHTHTVVFLHGRGDHARYFANALRRWSDSRGRNPAEAFPTFRWVLPQAPMRKLASGPETWPQWFDVWNARDFAENEELQAEGLREVIPVFRRMLADEAALLGGRWDRIVLAGISMGAATSAHLLFNLSEPLGAFMGFSGRCPFAGRSLAQIRDVLGLQDVPDHDEVLRKTPVLLEHCIDDPLVLIQNGRGLRDTLRGFGCQVEWREYPDGGHWFHSPTGMDDVVEFLEKHVLNKASNEGDSNEVSGMK